MEHLAFDAAGHPVSQGRVQRTLLDRIEASVGAVMVDQRVGALADQLVLGAAEHRGARGVFAGDPTVGIQHVEPYSDGVEDQLELRWERARGGVGQTDSVNRGGP
jgi:hypothetical protein